MSEFIEKCTKLLGGVYKKKTIESEDYIGICIETNEYDVTLDLNSISKLETKANDLSKLPVVFIRICDKELAIVDLHDFYALKQASDLESKF